MRNTIRRTVTGKIRGTTVCLAMQLTIQLTIQLAVTVAEERSNPRPTAPAVSRSAGDLQKLAWLKKNLPRLLPDATERAEVLKSLNHLSSPQLDTMMSTCLDELEARRRQQFSALKAANAAERARAEAAREEFQRRISAYHPRPAVAFPSAYWGLNPVGYVPVITWLPDGVGLTTQGVVSPDGRHVRVTANPVFTTIGPVYTFNYMTGETRRYPPEGGR